MSTKKYHVTLSGHWTATIEVKANSEIEAYEKAMVGQGTEIAFEKNAPDPVGEDEIQEFVILAH